MTDFQEYIGVAPKVALGKLIEPVVSVNKKGDILPFMGVNIEKQIVPTVANVSNINPSKYCVIRRGQFVFSGMQTGRDECIRFTLYSGDSPVLLSPAYTILEVIDKDVVLPEYIFTCFLSSEKDRLGWFYSDGSVRANLDLPRFLEIEIPLPSLDIQKKYVDAYTSLRQLAEQNEALLAPLSQTCRAYLAGLQEQYPLNCLGEYIECRDYRNSDGLYDVKHLQGVTSDSVFDTSKAKTDGIDFTKYKIVKSGDFAYNPSRINLGSIALRKGDDCIISPMYIVFGIKDSALETLLPEYLFLWFMRKEFQRSTWFYAAGSVRDTFDYNEMCRVRIPLPPLEVQKSIVALFRCSEEARSIAIQTRQTMREMCPAMVQQASHANA